MSEQTKSQPMLLGHPAGLFTLFFAEMWERFSYYGMRALLIFYMTKGFLAMKDGSAYAIYGAYTALVYATPFIGGMLADRLLGPRRAVILGGLLMAAGHLTMTFENPYTFYTALALLICGNGFFKPNISTIVGTMYPKGSMKKDAGFTIFYMGINLGAAMSPVICGYIGETYGWHYGFGLATAGMLIGVAVFVAPVRLTQALILIGALGTAIAMPFFQDTMLQLGVRLFLGVAIAIAGVIAAVALNRGGLPSHIGLPPNPEALTRKVGGVLRADWAVYLGVILSIPLFALLVSRHQIGAAMLFVAGAGALIYLLIGVLQSNKIERERMFVVLILMFFSMLFWAFFEQAGSSVNNFTDRNIDRVFQARNIEAADIGKSMKFRIPLVTQDKELSKLPFLSQEQLGFTNGGAMFSMTHLSKLRDKERKLGKVKQALAKLDKSDTKTRATLEKERASYKKSLQQIKRFWLNKKEHRITQLTQALPLLQSGLATQTLATDKQTQLRQVFKTDIDKALQEEAANFWKTGKITDDGLARLSKQLQPALATLLKDSKPNAKDSKLNAKDYKKLHTSLTKELADLRNEVTKIKRFAALLKANQDVRPEVYVWQVTPKNKGMGIAGAAIPASEFQAANPIFILLFGLFFTGLWGFLRARNMEPSTPFKFALGILQLGLGFGALWYGAMHADTRGMVGMTWLLAGYLLHTTGELCLSPVGLSMVTKLSPARLVSTVMGAWFMATAFSNYLAGLIATFTGVSHGGGKEALIPPPSATVGIYGGVFGKIAIAAIISSLICFALTPLLKKWMHEEAEEDVDDDVPTPTPASDNTDEALPPDSN